MITYHHIGGRNGTYPLPLKEGLFLEDIHLVLYDADIDCESKMHTNQKSQFSKVTVLPYCIGGETNISKFNVNFHPTTSSLYEFNNDYKHYSFVSNSKYGDYVLGNACQTVKNVDIHV